MKLKRPAVLASISLLTLGGLYYGLYRPGPEVIGETRVAHASETPPVVLHPMRSAAITPPFSNENSRKIPESVKSDSPDAGVRAGTAGSSRKQIEQPPVSGIRPITSDRKTSRPADTPAGPLDATGDNPARTPMGIRLAPDVRLPVAAMPNDLKLNPIKQKALQDIIDEYYQTVAAAVTAPGSGAVAGTPVAGEAHAANGIAQPAGTLVVEENGEETRVVANSPAVDSARKRADLRFKALFGHAAYNRMTMNTLLETRLPLGNTEP